MAQVKSSRPYRAELRKEQAGLTRARILDAARRLLVRGGYNHVTMQDVAREAGVAYQTVYSQFGNKNRLAVELCESGLPHVTEGLELLEQARAAGNAEAWLQTMGTVARRLYQTVDVLRFMRESGDSELIGRFKQIEQERRERLAEFGAQLERTGRLRPGISREQAVDVVWALAGPETYGQLVLDRGWTPEQFEAWLGPALSNLLLTP